jgi:hypothetical protein
MEGKTPSAKDRLASVEINSEKTKGHDLMIEVGTKSADEVLGFSEVRSRKTSMLVTAGNVLSLLPE